MTDNTHEAPERIWAGNEGFANSWDWEDPVPEWTEYVRADLVEAAEQQGYASAMEAERKLHEDRIEELEAKLAKAVEALAELATDEHPQGWIAIAALAELNYDERSEKKGQDQ